MGYPCRIAMLIGNTHQSDLTDPTLEQADCSEMICQSFWQADCHGSGPTRVGAT